MTWQQRVRRLIGRPVGISMKDGTGTDGVLCDVRNGGLYVMEYLYQKQFAMKQYEFDMIDDVNPYPPCTDRPQPRPVPNQPLY